MSSRRPASGHYKVAAGHAKAPALDRAGVDRLRQLYEISKLLTVFNDVEESVRAVLSAMAVTLPIRSAVLLLGSLERPKTFGWRAKGLGQHGLGLALAHAQTAYASLVGSRAVALRESKTSVNEFAAEREESAIGRELEPGDFILLPLVIGPRSIFGALQVEGAARLDESDLAFVNSVVNQLAVAIDRHEAVDAAQAAEHAKRHDAEERREAAEEAARAQHFLSDLSGALAYSMQYRNSPATCARLTVPFFADLCVIDEVADDGTILRLEVAIADGKTGERTEKSSSFAPTRGWQTAPAKVLDTGQPILIPNVDSFPLHVHDQVHLDVESLRVRSLIAVPLAARGRTLGVLSFATAESERRYGTSDLAFAIEISRRTAMAMDNARLFEETQRAVKQREDVVAIVSHDLRNPLSAILAVTQLLLRTRGPDHVGTDMQPKIQLIRRTAERMDRLIRDLLDLSSIDAGRLSIDVQPVGFNAIVAEALDTLRPNAEAKSLRLDVQLPAEEFQLRCDPARIVRVLLNLVGNAIKFTSPGGAISLSAEQRATMAFVRVSDSGPGIASDKLTHVFERYWQAPETASSGTGLGLYISKGFVEAHGGSIWAESTVDKGSTFFFTLPLSVAAPSSEERIRGL